MTAFVAAIVCWRAQCQLAMFRRSVMSMVSAPAAVVVPPLVIAPDGAWMACVDRRSNIVVAGDRCARATVRQATDLVAGGADGDITIGLDLELISGLDSAGDVEPPGVGPVLV